MQEPDVFPGPTTVFSTINEGKLLRSIWLQPTATLQFILSNCPDKYVTTLLVLGGIARAADRAVQQSTGDKMSTVGVLLLVFIVGGLTGWTTYFMYSWGLTAAGRWLGGVADSESFRIVLAWALVPSVVTLGLLLPQAVIFGDDLFKSNPVDTSALAINLSGFFALLQVTLSVWSVVILVQGVRLLQGFSVGRALANIVLPGAVVIGIIVLIAGCVKML